MFLQKKSKHLVFSNNLQKTFVQSKAFFKSNLTTKYKCYFLKKDFTGI